MDWNLMDKYVPVDGLVGAAGGDASRNVVLDIDTDIVLENLEAMAKALTDEQQSLLSGFSLSGAWTSTNATLVQEKVEQINASFAKMQGIIEKLQNKVNTYVTNTVEADTVRFNDGATDGGTGVGVNQNMTQ